MVFLFLFFTQKEMNERKIEERNARITSLRRVSRLGFLLVICIDIPGEVYGPDILSITHRQGQNKRRKVHTCNYSVVTVCGNTGYSAGRIAEYRSGLVIPNISFFYIGAF